MRALLISFLIAATALAQETGRVEGRVVDGGGAGVAKASVRLTTATGRTQTAYLETAGSDGRFVVEGLTPGNYQVTVQRAGYTVPNPMGSGLPATFTVVAGETRKVEIPMVRLAQVSGVVTDADGDPVPGVSVRLLRYGYMMARITLQAAASSTSDDRGQFRLANITPGRYYLAATAAGICERRN